MYRFILCFLASIQILGTSSSFAQQRPVEGQGQQAGAANAQQPQMTRELWQLMTDWSRSSSKIEHLYGKHERHVYNLAFETEQISEGVFGYAKPDKGRIEMKPVEITQKLIQARNHPSARVERKVLPDGKPGAPFDLKADSSERWLCDGEKVYDIDDAKREARVVQLPPDQRGENIMNTPLPFLFGMPPDKAAERFNITLEKDYRPEQQFVALSVTPRTRQDSDNWCLAQVILNTQTWLPEAVKLTDPAKTKRTLYKFTEMKTGVPLTEYMRLKNPWDPKLNGYKIHMITPGQDPLQQQMAAQPAVKGFPDLSGMAHNIAEERLIAAGFPAGNITKVQAGPAPNADLKFKIASHEPAPGAAYDRSSRIVLKVYTAPLAVGAARPVGGASRQ